MQPIQLSLFERPDGEEKQIIPAGSVSKHIPEPQRVFWVDSDYEAVLAEEVNYAIEIYLPRTLGLVITETITPNQGSDMYSHEFIANHLIIDGMEMPFKEHRFGYNGESSSYSERDIDSLFGDIATRVMDAHVNVRSGKLNVSENGRKGVFKGTLDFLINHQSAI